MATIMTPEEHKMAVFLLGPWLVGCFMDIFFQGILLTQFINYWTWYRDDKLSLRLAVTGLITLTTLKSIQSFALIWIMVIDNFQDLEGAILLNYTTWWQSNNSLFVAIIGFYVQIYFCYRLLVISKSYYVVAPLLSLFIFAFIAQVMAVISIVRAAAGEIAAIELWFAAHLGSVFAGDFLLTALTVFFLIRARRNVQSQAIGLISALIRLTFQSAAPAALCALFNLIFSQVYNGNEVLISTAFNQMLPKLYAISMMWTLNARKSIRMGSSGGGVSSNGSSGYRSGAPGTKNNRKAMENHELGTFGNGGPIQVRTVQETVKHIDFDGTTKSKIDQDSDSGIGRTDDYYLSSKGSAV